MKTSVIEKYLDQYAEEEAQDLTLPASYDHSLVIPAHQETLSSLKAVWQNIPEHISLLVTIVVNSSKSSSNSEIRLFDDLMNEDQITELRPGTYLISKSAGPDLIIIDRFSEKRTINNLQGVGLARKIGCDVTLQLYHSNCINSPWLRNTDADAVLPTDYFDIEISDVSGFLYPFRHLPGSLESNSLCQQPLEEQLATSLYDLSLLYYPAGLRQAGSIYGFPSVGSTLCCTAKAYAQIRGFPKRNTGEDFYLLNKLCKVGPVKAIDCSPIELSSRLSTRVPIGTGQAIARISDLSDPIHEFQFEHPDCFKRLHDFLRQLSQIADSGDTEVLDQDQTISFYVKTSGLRSLIEKKLEVQRRPEVRLKFMMDWFDALRTRQFIHAVRDRDCGSVSLEELTRYFDVKESAEAAIATLRYQFANRIYQ